VDARWRPHAPPDAMFGALVDCDLVRQPARRRRRQFGDGRKNGPAVRSRWSYWTAALAPEIVDRSSSAFQPLKVALVKQGQVAPPDKSEARR
jgi:hypothetical protein